MKITAVIYWAATGLLATAMAFSAYAYLTQPAMKQAFEHLELMLTTIEVSKKIVVKKTCI